MATGRGRQALPAARAQDTADEGPGATEAAPSDEQMDDGQRQMEEAAAVMIQSVVRGNQSRWASQVVRLSW